MRWLIGFAFLVLALGTLCIVGCEEARIPCENFGDCPPPDDECLHVTCISPFCRYFADQHGAGCELSDGSMGVCEPSSTFSPDSPGCGRTSEPIPCVHGYNNSSKYLDGTLCRVPDGREGTCLDGVCGGEHFCEGVVCDEPDNLCESDPFCNWEGACEFRQITRCNEGNSCTDDRCDPNRGCVYTRRPNGADCLLPEDWGCCFWSLGWGACCHGGTCQDGVCIPD
jgi:hypothetical protein